MIQYNPSRYPEPVEMLLAQHRAEIAMMPKPEQSASNPMPFGVFDYIMPVQTQPDILFDIEGVHQRNDGEVIYFHIPCILPDGRKFAVDFNLPTSDGMKLKQADFIEISKRAYYDAKQRGEM